MKVEISVPGKVIISGEHSVVYGKPAIVAAVDRRLRVVLQKTTDNRQVINSNYSDTSLVKKAIEFFVDPAPFDTNKDKVKRGWAGRLKTMKGFKLNIDSEIPIGAGMGSSAAVAVGVAAAFIAASTGEAHLDLQKINQLAYKIEKIQHGTPSGVDNSIVTFGGFLWYRKEFEFLKTFWKLKFKLAEKLDNFYLLNTGKPKETTGEMIALVRSKLKIHLPAVAALQALQAGSSKLQFKTQNLLHRFEQITKKIMLSLREEDEKSLMDGIRKNQKLLEDIGVVGKFAKKIVREIEESGGAAKISGAGGIKDKSGIILAYHKNKSQIVEIAKKYKLPFFPAKLGSEGVKIEKIRV